MQGANGSPLIDSTPVLVQLAAGKPGLPPLQLQVWPDWRGAPSEGHALTSVLVLAVLAAHQTIATLANRLAALEVAVTEGERLRHSLTVERTGLGRALTCEETARAHSRRDMALASVADQIEITATPTGVLTDDRVGPPASALDLLGVEDGPAPAPAGVAGPTSDGGD